MGGVPPSHNTVILLLCAVSFLLNRDPNLRIFSLRTLQIRALTACPDPQPTPFVSPATIAYIHGLIIDSVTALQTDSTTTRALRCETMARQELESMPLADFHFELRLALTSYYQGIVKTG